MEKDSIRQRFLRDIGIGESIIGTGVMQEYSVDSGNSKNYRIGSGAFPIHDQTVCAVTGQNVPDHSTEGIIAYFSHQLNIRTQNFEGKTCVGYAAAGVNICRLHLNQFSGDQKVVDIAAAAIAWENRSDINADMACRDDLSHHNKLLSVPDQCFATRLYTIFL